MRAAVIVLAALAFLTVALVARGDDDLLTREACARSESARNDFSEMAYGQGEEPHGPIRATDAVSAFRNAGFTLPDENQLWHLYDVGLRFPDICDFRLFNETNPFATPVVEQGQLKIFVVATAELGAYEYGERRRLAAKYRYTHAVEVVRKGNVVVEYFFELEDGTKVRRNRVDDVRRIVAGL